MINAMTEAAELALKSCTRQRLIMIAVEPFGLAVRGRKRMAGDKDFHFEHMVAFDQFRARPHVLVEAVRLAAARLEEAK